MGFNLPGKSIHSGTNSHRSALKMKQEQDAALKMTAEQGGGAEPGSSPNKYLPIVAREATLLPAVIKQAPKVAKFARTGFGNIGKTTTTFKPNILGKIKGVYDKAPNIVKNIVKQGAIYAGIDTGINMLTGGKDKKSDETTTTPKTTTKKSGPSPYSKAKKNDPNLGSYIKERKKHKKGSAEYNALQNKINKAYGDKTRHGVESSSSTKGRKTTSSMNVPGISNTKTVTRKRRSGDVKSTKTTNVNTGTTTKRKYTKKGDTKKIVTKKDGMRTVTKKNRKGKVTTKTRKTLNPFD